ncbi:uncharacterized protein LOC105940092 isoform X1 [Fundulus heteroclitus]|uniref:uncharacterized protein LOC105940092 isoform X1 n=1 Tax=Fundulus heteroclitus TaxID=8078 RepID=UPI00165A68AA|nr:uncharacterized protein LOC105940092 isoform X1 [Fundulus heteroclitus]
MINRNRYGGEPMDERQHLIKASSGEGMTDLDRRKGNNEIGKKFYVFVEGVETGAQRSIVQWVKSIGQTQVNLPADCDYILVFCPIASRVEADISGALDNVSGYDKPVILVVLHHTRQQLFNKTRVPNPIVWLTVDFLFWEDTLLDCTCNTDSWGEIQTLLGRSRQLGIQSVKGWLKSPKIMAIVGGVVVIVIAVVLIIVFTRKSNP